MLVLAVIVLPQAVRADWDPSIPVKMHWAQLPDLSPMGIDVNATAGWILADDFRCKQSGPITGIHVWGSWRHDVLPGNTPVIPGDPGAVKFALSIHEDIPKNGTIPSKPGPAVWVRQFQQHEFLVRPYMMNIQEGWLEYPDGQGYEMPGDTQCWLYNFNIPEALAFPQEVGKTYWLDVQAFPDPGFMGPEFGWKTTVPSLRWNDDAVWGFGEEPGIEIWTPMTYPVGHELEGQSMDLAFVITPEPATMALLGLGVAGLVARRRNKK